MNKLILDQNLNRGLNITAGEMQQWNLNDCAGVLKCC
jgi:hypothetical protein